MSGIVSFPRPCDRFEGNQAVRLQGYDWRAAVRMEAGNMGSEVAWFVSWRDRFVPR